MTVEKAQIIDFEIEIGFCPIFIINAPIVANKKDVDGWLNYSLLFFLYYIYFFIIIDNIHPIFLTPLFYFDKNKIGI